MSLPVISLEDHFCPAIMRERASLQKEVSGFPKHVVDALYDTGPRRLEDMSAGHVSIQVMSHGPGATSEAIDYVRAANDELAAACRSQPQRYAGFAALPMGDPAAAAAELERCVTQLGFVGALLDSHLADGRFFDHRRFWPVFEAAQRLDVPVYLHPASPAEAVRRIMYEGEWGAGD